ncbi:hypothetical protein A5739_19710 [Mycobacterium colombiense]|nr:hypothetical protein A5739_19710 [Mycobacterium colombiense]
MNSPRRDRREFADHAERLRIAHVKARPLLLSERPLAHRQVETPDVLERYQRAVEGDPPTW